VAVKFVFIINVANDADSQDQSAVFLVGKPTGARNRHQQSVASKCCCPRSRKPAQVERNNTRIATESKSRTINPTQAGSPECKSFSWLHKCCEGPAQHWTLENEFTLWTAACGGIDWLTLIVANARLLRLILRRLDCADTTLRRLLIVGAVPRARWFANEIRQWGLILVCIIGYVDDERISTAHGLKGVPRLGGCCEPANDYCPRR